MTNAMENAIREARAEAIRGTALELMKNMKAYGGLDTLKIAIEGAAIAIAASFGGAKYDIAEEIEKTMGLNYVK